LIVPVALRFWQGADVEAWYGLVMFGRFSMVSCFQCTQPDPLCNSKASLPDVDLTIPCKLKAWGRWSDGVVLLMFSAHGLDMYVAKETMVRMVDR
jgi:hypothetical protein